MNKPEEEWEDREWVWTLKSGVMRVARALPSRPWAKSWPSYARIKRVDSRGGWRARLWRDASEWHDGDSTDPWWAVVTCSALSYIDTKGLWGWRCVREAPERGETK